MSPINRSTANLLRRYVNGAITAPEEAELERRAQTDESLAEAMRGLQSAPEEDHAARINRMVVAARQRGQNSAKVIPARSGRFRWAAAAAVLLLVASSLFFLPALLDSNAGDLAMTSAPQAKEVDTAPASIESTTPLTTAAEPEAEAPTQPPSPAPSSSTQDPRPRPENELKDSPRIGASSRADEQAAASRVRAQEETRRREAAKKLEQRTPPPPPPAFEEDGVEEEMADEIITPAPQAAPTVLPSPSVAAGAPNKPISTADRKARVKRQDNRSVTTDDAATSFTQPGSITGAYLDGRITNENGYPIANALVRLPGLPLGERTDSNGIFQLPADAAATALDISHPNYESERVNLTDPAETLQISLERKEFVADDDRPRWQQDAASTRIVFDKKTGYASPLEGYNTLRQRIEEDKPDNVRRGKVKFSFLVNPDGTLTDIQFRGKPDQATMDYIGTTLVSTSVWEVVQGDEPVRVYFKVVFR